MGEARKKRRWKPEEIAAILRRVHLDRVEVSTVCEETGCCPSRVYRRQKQLFDQGGQVFRVFSKACGNFFPQWGR
jgi:transposase-like protein